MSAFVVKKLICCPYNKRAISRASQGERQGQQATSNGERGGEGIKHTRPLALSCLA
jgi:hypothetical protein